MMRRVWTMLAVLAVVATGTTAGAQKTTQTGPGTGGSPHVKTEWTIDGAALAVEYGRPYLKGRTDAQVMPPGKPWRTGADQPTLLVSDKPLTVGTLKLEPGTYTINTIPEASGWQLLIGRYTGTAQWGIPYRQDLEIGRTPMTLARTAAPVEQVTVHIDDTPAGATLRVEWGSASATVPMTVG